MKNIAIICINISVFLLLMMGVTSSVFAVTYTLCTDGTWGNNAGSSSARFDSGGGCTLNPYDITWAVGDILEIPTGTYLILESNQTISPEVTVDITGDIYFDNGKLTLSDANSTLVMQEGGHLYCGTPGSTVACPANSQIVINGTQYKAGDLDTIEAAPRPSTVDETGSVLPITLVHFNANTDIAKKHIQLEWSTASEENFDYFQIEKSLDGIYFKTIGTLNGVGESTTLVYYDFTDSNPIPSNNYYRLKAIDLDGTFEYSDVILENFDGEVNFEVYPNPVTNGALSLKLPFKPDGLTNFNIINAMGKVVYSKRVSDQISEHQLSSYLPKGIYYAQIIIGADIQSIRIVL